MLLDAIVPESRRMDSGQKPRKSPPWLIDVGRCTLEDAGLHSYRRDGQDSGRFAGLVWLS